MMHRARSYPPTLKIKTLKDFWQRFRLLLRERGIRDRIAPYFDTEFYCRTYPDIAAARQQNPNFDPVLHYVRFGWIEGRNPSCSFQTTQYLMAHPQLVASGKNPLLHFIEREGTVTSPVGQPAPLLSRDEISTREEPDNLSDAHPVSLPGAEALTTAPPERPNEVTDSSKSSGQQLTTTTRDFRSENYRIVAASFDRAYYLRRYADLAAFAREHPEFDPVLHYLETGWMEGRDPNAVFSTSDYLELNPDVREAKVNPFYHYLTAGKSEGRFASLPGGYRARHLRSLITPRRMAELWRRPARETWPLSRQSVHRLISRALHNNDGKIVVALSHDDYMANLGGIQLCIRREQLAFQAMGAGYLHLAPVQPSPILADADEWSNQHYSIRYNGAAAGITTAAALVAAVEELSASFRDGCAFIVHALHGSATEFALSVSQAVPWSHRFYWVHDFLGLCPGYNLLRNGIQFCRAPTLHSGACQVCIYGEDRVHHLHRMDRLFSGASFEFVAPSKSAADLWRGFYPKHKVVVRPHCFLEPTGLTRALRNEGDPVRVGYIGHPAFHKGWPVFESLQKLGIDKDLLELHYFGAAQPALNGDVIVHRVSVDSCNPEAMVTAVSDAKLDFALLWSICPETFCLAAYEAYAGGALILSGPDSGNVERFVKNNRAGYVFANEDALFSFLSSPDLVSAVPRKPRRLYKLRFGSLSAEMVEQGMVAP